MLAYEEAGGVLDIREKSAKKYFEKYYRRHKRSLKEKMQEIEVNGDIEQNDSWDDD